MAYTAPSDETLYCENCGISFLWTGEEQRSDPAGSDTASRPLRCPGCRSLLPPEGQERGLVKWYSARKRYGFIVRPNQPDLFFHRSELTGATRLQGGDLVEYGISEADGRVSARDVRALVHGEEYGEE